jgi:hypothetical protein
MDPEIQRELEEQFRRLSELLAQQSELQANLNRSIEDQVKSQNASGTATKNNTQSVKNNETALGSSTKRQEAYEAATAKTQQAIESFDKGLRAAGSALTSFTKSFLSSETGFKKYSETLDNAGSAMWNVGKEFGIVGKILGGLGAAAGKVAGVYLKQADDLLTATDSLAKMGAGATLTTEEVRQMGAGAGLASYELDKLIKPMKSIQGGFLALGDSATSGIKRFGDLVEVSREVREEFQRLGMGDEERNQALADFVTMMNKSGAIASGSLKTQQGLQKAALEYTRNLYELAQLTGEDVETVKKQKEAAAMTLEVALQNNKWEQERIAAERRGDKAALERIEKEKKGFDNFTNELIQAGATQEQIVAAQNQFLTGAITEQSAKFSMWGVNMDDYIQKHKEGSAVPGEFAQAYKEGAQGFLNSVGQGTVALSKDLQEAGGYTDEFVRNLNKRTGRDEADAKAAAAAEKKANADGKSAAATDNAQINRNQLTEAEREAKLAIDALVSSTNPLLNANLELAKQFERLKDMIKFVLDNLKTFATIIGVIVGATVLGKVVTLFRGLSGASSGLINAFKKASGWLMGLLGMKGPKVPGSPKAPAGPKQGPDGRWRDERGRFTSAPTPDAPGKSSKLLNFAKGGARILGKLALPLTAGMAAYDAYQGFNADPNASFGGKMANAGKSALSGMTFGLSEYITGGVTSDTQKELQEKAKETTEKQAQIVDKNETSSTKTILSTEKTTELNKKTIVLFGKLVASFGKIVAANGKIVGAFGDLVKVFDGSVRKFETTVKNLMDNLNLVIGTSASPLGMNANSPATVDAVMAMNYQKESAGGTQLRVKGMGNAGTIGGGYGLSNASRKSAFESMTDEQKANFTQQTGFTKAPTLNQLVNKEGTAFLSEQARLADTLLARQFTESTIQNLTKRLGRQPTMADVRGAHWLGETGYARFLSDLATNPNMTMAEFYDKHKNFGGNRPDMKQFGGGKMTLQQFQEKLIEHAGGVGGGSLKNLVSTGALKLGGGLTGNMRNLDNIDPSFENSLASAIAEYYQKTNRSITLTSGYRYPGDQGRISSGSNPKAAPGKSRHERGLAVDINSSDVSALNGLGLLDKYGLIGGQASSSQGGYVNDPPHIELKAARGGVFTGPSTGYPVELHGQEMVAPLSMDSILMKLAKTPALSIEGEMIEKSITGISKSSTSGNEATDAILKMHSELINVLSTKLDNMIDVLDEGNDTREKIFKHSMV